jgi:hypothetical protein
MTLVCDHRETHGRLGSLGIRVQIRVQPAAPNRPEHRRLALGVDENVTLAA